MRPERTWGFGPGLCKISYPEYREISRGEARVKHLAHGFAGRAESAVAILEPDRLPSADSASQVRRLPERYRYLSTIIGECDPEQQPMTVVGMGSRGTSASTRRRPRRSARASAPASAASPTPYRVRRSGTGAPTPSAMSRSCVRRRRRYSRAVEVLAPTRGNSCSLACPKRVRSENLQGERW